LRISVTDRQGKNAERSKLEEPDNSIRNFFIRNFSRLEYGTRKTSQAKKVKDMKEEAMHLSLESTNNLQVEQSATAHYYKVIMKGGQYFPINFEQKALQFSLS